MTLARLIGRRLFAMSREATDRTCVSAGCCCAAASLLPLSLLIFFENREPPSSRLAASLTHRAAYLTFRHTTVGGPAGHMLSNVSDERACARLCDDPRSACSAFSFDHAHRRCTRHSRVASLTASGASSAAVRRGASWTLHSASRLRWEHNATLVLAWSGGDLGWLRRLPPVLDIAVIAVAPPSANTSSSSSSSSSSAGAAAAARGGQQPAPHELLRFGLRLKHYAALPLTPRVETCGPLRWRASCRSMANPQLPASSAWTRRPPPRPRRCLRRPNLMTTAAARRTTR